MRTQARKGATPWTRVRALGARAEAYRQGAAARMTVPADRPRFASPARRGRSPHRHTIATARKPRRPTCLDRTACNRSSQTEERFMLRRMHRGAGVALAVGAIAVGAPAAVVFANPSGGPGRQSSDHKGRFADHGRGSQDHGQHYGDHARTVWRTSQETSRRPWRVWRSWTPPRELHIPRAADLGRRPAPVRPRMVCQQSSRLGAGQAGRRGRRVLTRRRRRSPPTRSPA